MGSTFIREMRVEVRGAAEICQEFRPGKAAAKAAVLRLLRSLMRGPHWAPQAPRARLLDHNEVKFLRSVSKIFFCTSFYFTLRTSQELEELRLGYLSINLNANSSI